MVGSQSYPTSAGTTDKHNLLILTVPSQKDEMGEWITMYPDIQQNTSLGPCKQSEKWGEMRWKGSHVNL